jgi:AraC-like DNA-binding protein
MVDSKLNGKSNLKIATKKLYVKYMVSLRCKEIVKEELNKLGLKFTISTEGAIEFFDEIRQEQLDELDKNLKRTGLVLLSENNSILVDRIINTIIELIHYSDELPKLNFKEIINENIVSGNESILKIFSDVMGMSVIKFIINQKIERTKELLLYDDLPLSVISEKLNYKNEEFLIAQFKKVSGHSPAYFKQIRKARVNISAQNLENSYPAISDLINRTNS